MSLLEVSGLAVHYGPIAAVQGVAFKVDAGRMVGLIGRNGAGKSTILQAICGLVRPSGGSVVFDGQRIDRLPAHEVVRLGVAYVPEGRRVFADLSVHDNLTLGAFMHLTGRGRVAASEGYDRVYSMFPILRERAQQPAGTLSGGQQQMLAIGRALMSGPRLLMLDEPSMGLAPVVVNELFATISQLHRQGLTVLVVEQKAFKTLKMVDHAHVVVHGRIALDGTGAELLANDEVKASYLGRDKAAVQAAAEILGMAPTAGTGAGAVTPSVGSPAVPASAIAPAPTPVVSGRGPLRDVAEVDAEPAVGGLAASTCTGGIGAPGPASTQAGPPPGAPTRGLRPGEQPRPELHLSREQSLRRLHQRTRA